MLESMYEEALCVERFLRDIPFERQVEQDVIYKGRRIKGQRIDLLVANGVIVEIKSMLDLPEVAFAQVLSYLRLRG